MTLDNTNNYHSIAELYDWLMGEKKYKIWKDIVELAVKKYRIPTGNCLDVACGTGAISKFMQELGFQPIGVDRSVEMLAVARKKLPAVKFYCQDIRQLAITEKAVLAVSFYDSLNYLLTDEDMLNTFKSVAKALGKDGYFIFDMNTTEHVTASQKNKPRIFRGDGHYVVFRWSGEARIWEIDIDFFIKQTDSGLFKLTSEKHFERAYDAADITPLLATAGFSLIELQQEFKVYEDNQEHLSRLYFIAKKDK